MPPIVAAGYQAVQTFTLGNGDVAQNVLHFTSDATPEEATANALANGLRTAWENNLKVWTSNLVTFRHVRVASMATSPYPVWEYDFLVPGTDGTDNVLPYQLAACISLHTGTPGRSGRGRIYMGGFCEDSNTAAGAIATALDADLSDYANALQSILISTGVDAVLGVYSRKLNVMSDVTQVTVDSRWDVQRRRANRRLF